MRRQRGKLEIKAVSFIPPVGISRSHLLKPVSTGCWKVPQVRGTQLDSAPQTDGGVGDSWTWRQRPSARPALKGSGEETGSKWRGQ